MIGYGNFANSDYFFNKNNVRLNTAGKRTDRDLV